MEIEKSWTLYSARCPRFRDTWPGELNSIETGFQVSSPAQLIRVIYAFPSRGKPCDVTCNAWQIDRCLCSRHCWSDDSQCELKSKISQTNWVIRGYYVDTTCNLSCYYMNTFGAMFESSSPAKWSKRMVNLQKNFSIDRSHSFCNLENYSEIQTN